MFHKKNNIYSFMLILGLIFLTACQKSPSASQIALSYYDLIIKQNTSDIISLGMPNDTAEAITSHIKENLHTQIAEKLCMNQRITIDDRKITQLEEAYLTSLQKLSRTASHQKEGENYLVTLSTTYIDYAAIDEIATEAALKEIDISQFTDEVLYLSDLTDAYISHLITGYQNAEPSTLSNTETFTFTSQNGLWLPADYDSFVAGICELVSTTNKDSNS